MDAAAADSLPYRSLTPLHGFGITALIVACLLNIAAVYMLVAVDARAFLVMSVGIVGMAEAWSGAFFVERKRLMLARGLAATGMAEVFLYALPAVRESVAGTLIVAGGVLSATGLVLTWTRR